MMSLLVWSHVPSGGGVSAAQGEGLSDSRRPLQRSVRTLLECSYFWNVLILVSDCFILWLLAVGEHQSVGKFNDPAAHSILWTIASC